MYKLSQTRPVFTSPAHFADYGQTYTVGLNAANADVQLTCKAFFSTVHLFSSTGLDYDGDQLLMANFQTHT